MKTKTMYKNAEGEIRVVQIFFGNEVFELRYNKERNFWMMWRKEKYPLPDKEGEYFKTIVDVNGKMNFEKDDFISALKEIGGVIEEDE